MTIKIIDIKNCKNSSEKKDLNHCLKNQLNESIDKDRNANGESKINTFIIIKRKEYENISVKRPVLQKDFIIPFSEKISIEVLSSEIIEFNSVTSVLKVISLEIILEPIS